MRRQIVKLRLFCYVALLTMMFAMGHCKIGI
jgi:hypothetical protein